MAKLSSGESHIGDKSGYTGKISGVVLSFADETFTSWRDCYIPDFLVECCNCGVGYRTLRLRIMYGFDDEMYDIVN